ncbi:MAG: 3-oxoacyl-ACP reductase FabG [Sphingomonadales bacterium]|nr:3-oxoacyl-ACP reductase FabG [Sphingomonadales bacterium]
MDAYSRLALTGRVALVTGGGTGIGKATAKLLAARGADLMLAGRRIEPLQEAAAEITAESGRTVMVRSTDVTDAEAAQAMVADAVAAFGRLDILVNNAGVGRHKPLRTLKPEHWDGQVQLNLSAAFYCSQAAYPHLKAAGNSAIVNISSLAGVNGTLGVGAYSAAKAGLHQLSRVLAAEWGPKGIRVNTVAPGMIATELAKSNWAKNGFDAMAACQGFPLRRYGECHELAEAVAFLASDAASYVTGELLVVGGGPQLKGMIDTDDD